ncbi:MerR family transcriptional regulator [Dactylosporangium sp. CA-092794]|uniref:MerR family transcriptional regulator n=1 Tax=Dactylosporangium sp. CA-092794 TaxID=3239929 RepID=UPI003D947EA5
MRISELAELAGSTVRTIRYYHQIGLIPVPPARHGRRDYDLTHLARLVRIRWLAQAGIPLATIAAMLGDEPPPAAAPDPAGGRHESVLADLRASVAALDAQLADLRAQRERIAGLIAAVERDGHLSPMPAALVRFYDRLEAEAGDEHVRRVIRRERDFMELAFYRGDMPPESAVVYERITEVQLAESRMLFDRIAERASRRDEPGPHEIAQIVDAVVDRLTRQLGPDLPALARSIDLGVARRAADLYVRLSDARMRPVQRAIADAILSVIEKGQVE